MTTSVVSVIIPTFNRAVRVQRAISSALEQTHGEMRAIVIDDGSTDHTAEQLEGRFGSDDRFVFLRTENRGVAAARNTGLEQAAGSHIAFLDSDDEWYPWKIEFQLECLDRLPDAELVWTDMAAVDANGSPIAHRYLRAFYRRYAEIDLAEIADSSQPIDRPDADGGRLWYGNFYPAMLGGNLVHTSTVLMTSDLCSSVGGFDESLTTTGEDFDFHLRACAAGPVAFADLSTINYRVGAPDQLTHPDLMVQMARNYLKTIDKAVTADNGRTSDTGLRRAQAGAHAWLGEELLEVGERKEAAIHLRTAMRGRRSLRIGALLMISRLPMRAGAALRWILGSVTRPFRRRRSGE